MVTFLVGDYTSKPYSDYSSDSVFLCNGIDTLGGWVEYVLLGTINLSYTCRKWVCIWYHCEMRGCIWSGFVFVLIHDVYRLWICNWWLVPLDRRIENATTYGA